MTDDKRNLAARVKELESRIEQVNCTAKQADRNSFDITHYASAIQMALANHERIEQLESKLQNQTARQKTLSKAVKNQPKIHHRQIEVLRHAHAQATFKLETTIIELERRLTKLENMHKTNDEPDATYDHDVSHSTVPHCKKCGCVQQFTEQARCGLGCETCQLPSKCTWILPDDSHKDKFGSLFPAAQEAIAKAEQGSQAAPKPNNDAITQSPGRTTIDHFECQQSHATSTTKHVSEITQGGTYVRIEADHTVNTPTLYKLMGIILEARS